MPDRICTRCATPIPHGATRCPECAPTPRLNGRKRQDVNRLILLRDNYQCQLRLLCDGALATCVDHIVPLADGGTNAADNLQAACQPCNQHKGDR